MCGIIGILGKGDVPGALLDGLKRLEYRGYDSTGIATLVQGKIERRRAEGKIANLEALLRKQPLTGATGIGHTRWATHGRPSENNAHPHATDKVAVVHNGIIENFRELREALRKKGTVFNTETDTEIVLHLVDDLLGRGFKPVDAVKATLSQLRGAFALGFIFAGEDDPSFAENFVRALRQRKYLIIRVNAWEAKQQRNNFQASSDRLDLLGIAR